MKSAYHVLADNRDLKKNKQKGESSNTDVSVNAFKWSNIWRLTCQPKVKQFLWRLAHNSLPLRTKISRKGMDIDTRCPVCLRLDEDGGHCFLKCKMVKKCWIAMFIEHIRIDLLESNSAKNMVVNILSLEQETKMKVICLLWAWWEACNKANAGEQLWSIEEVVHRAMSINSFGSMHWREKKDKPMKEKVQWCPPNSEYVKINFDGSFIQNRKSGASGFVVRDHDRFVIMAGAGNLDKVHDAICAEAHACLIAITAAADQGMMQI